MKVILLKELKGKGGEGDVIDVAAGYANNYLLTQGYAVKATKGNLKQLEERRKNIEKREEVRLADAHKLEESLNGKSLKSAKRASSLAPLPTKLSRMLFPASWALRSTVVASMLRSRSRPPEFMKYLSPSIVTSKPR